MTAQQTVRVGLVGAGLMGREAAAAFQRWPALLDHPVRPVLTAVCDPDEARREWFARFESVRLRTADHTELLADDRLDVVYVAVPHDLHESIYRAVLDAGKDLFAEKPFGIDLPAARRLMEAVASSGAFVRVSSEIPYFPGAQHAVAAVRQGLLGQPIEAYSAFLHSSDLDPDKPISWKRRRATCGDIGVMGDLGLHAVHVPFRLGWQPHRVYAVLQDLVPERPGPDGSAVPCDTLDNATLLCDVESADGPFPLQIETKRIAPREMNTWTFRALGFDGGVEYSTRQPKTIRRFTRAGDEQRWEELEVGSQSCFPTITGGIFEFGFADSILQMWAAYLAERAGALGDAFGCATPEEALASHELFDAALRSGAEHAAAPVGTAGR